MPASCRIQDADGRGGSGFVSHHLDPRSAARVRRGVQNGRDDGLRRHRGIRARRSVNDEPGCNPYSVPTEVPPARPACVARYFEPGRVPGADARSHRAAAVPPRGGPHRAAVIVFRSGVDRGGGTRPAHHPERGDEGDADGPRFRRIRAESADHRRGAPRGEACRAAAALQNKRAESREKKEDAARAAAKRSGGGSVPAAAEAVSQGGGETEREPREVRGV